MDVSLNLKKIVFLFLCISFFDSAAVVVPHEEIAGLIVHGCNHVLENIFVFQPDSIKTIEQRLKLIRFAADVKNEEAITVVESQALTLHEPPFDELALVITHNYTRVLEALLKLFPELVASVGFKGQSLLHVASEHGRITATNILKKYKADINACDNDAQTPLHYAVSARYSLPKDVDRYSRIISLLLDKGADINAVDSNGCTPLFVAISKNNYEGACALINFGADMEIVPEGVVSLLAYAEDKCTSNIVDMLTRKQQEIDNDCMAQKQKQLQEAQEQLGDNGYKQLLNLDEQCEMEAEEASEYSELARDIAAACL